MNFSFKITCSSEARFIEHWASKYQYQMTEKSLYAKHIGKPLTARSRNDLFTWKNGGPISTLKIRSIEENYPLTPPSDIEARYLNHRLSGGAIWNIFYLHCLDPAEYPIFDQHNFRAMRYLKNGLIENIPTSKKSKYSIYINEFKPFFRSFKSSDSRQVDKALFAFGQFLKKANDYT